MDTQHTGPAVAPANGNTNTSAIPEGTASVPEGDLNILNPVIAVVEKVVAATPAVPPEPDRPLLRPHQTDLGNAQRLVMLYGSSIRYVPQWKTWIIWDGRRWRVDEKGRIMGLAKRANKVLFLQGSHHSDTDQRASWVRFALASEARARLEAAAALAESEEGVIVEPNELDADPWLLNVKNGTLDLRTGTLRQYRREDLMTKLAPVDYDPQAECPRFVKFLERIVPDVDTRSCLQRALGYSLTGDVSEQCLFMPYGPGKNGKSTLLKTIRAVLGDYAKVTPSDTLLIKQDKGAPRDDLVRLQGARFVLTMETEEDRRLAEALIKRMTGGDPIAARTLYSKLFEYDPAFKLWVAVNHLPVVQGTDDAIWRRLKRIPFTETITAVEDDKHLDAKLYAERPGILRWLVEGCLEWQRLGLGFSQAIVAATDDYRREMDVFDPFITERTEIDQKATTTSADLYQAYTEWCQDADVARPLSKRKFGQRLKALGLAAGSTGESRTWEGIKLRCISENRAPSGNDYPGLREAV